MGEGEAYSEVIDGVVVQVEPGLEVGDLLQRESFRELARAVGGWVDRVQSRSKRGSLLKRETYTPPNNPYDEMAAAWTALENDDVVSGVYEITESFAFQGVKLEGEDEDTIDIANQIARDVDLDSVLRRLWREIYATNQVVVAASWYDKTYKPRTKTPGGKASKKNVTLRVPRKIAVLDGSCVVPFQKGPLNDEILCWSATDAELEDFNASKGGSLLDADLDDFFIAHYHPSDAERVKLTELGITNHDRLLVMNPKYVQRFTATKSDYELFADVRLKPLFGLLDLKRQLMDQDRVNLVGAANFILLIRKGEKDQPATAEELENLRDNYSVMAKLPVIIADHRLSIDIVAPSIDLVLKPEKYDLIDSRILSRLLGTLSIGGKGQRNETNVTMSYAVARGMENRRHMLKRFLERFILRPLHEMNDGKLKEEPNLAFVPAKIQLGFDSALSQMLASLYSTRDISRETTLEFVGLDQATEAIRKQIEEERYDEHFGDVLMPGQVDANGNVVSPQVVGGQGGRPQGGGDPASNPTKAGPKTPAGNSKKGTQS